MTTVSTLLPSNSIRAPARVGNGFAEKAEGAKARNVAARNLNGSEKVYVE
jgi:hypothetical protein